MRPYLIVSQAIYLLALIPWLFVIIMSPMAFDAGFSTWNLSLVAILIAYPIAVIVCSLVAWILHRKHARTSAYLNLIPALWFIGAAVAFSVSR